MAVESEYALPLDEALFTYIMKKAQGWGMVLYEQVNFHLFLLSCMQFMYILILFNSGLVGYYLHGNGGNSK